MRIIGIDPGSVFCGYGVIDSINSNLTLIEYGTIEVKKKISNFNLRLGEIYVRINSVLERTKPEQAAIESVFYSQNPQTLIKLSHARAVAILAIINNNIPISEYSTREIKKSVSGCGGASKEQVQFMIKKLLNISKQNNISYFDTTDALAVAVCHSNKQKNNKITRHSKSWSDFIKNNQDRIIKL